MIKAGLIFKYDSIFFRVEYISGSTVVCKALFRGIRLEIDKGTLSLNYKEITGKELKMLKVNGIK